MSPGGEGDRLGESNGRRNGRIDLGVADTGQLSGVAAESANATVGRWDQLIYRCGGGPCQESEGRGMSGQGYLTESQLFDLDRRLSDRDRRITQLVGTLSIVSGSQLRRVFFAGVGGGRHDAQLARRALLRLTGHGLLERLERRIGGMKAGSDGFCYRLAPAGQRLIDFWSGEGLARGRRLPEPSPRFTAHRLAVSEVYVQAHEAATAGRLELLSFEAEPACWRQYIGPTLGALTLKPDALARVGVDEWELAWFIEVDLGTVGQATRTSQAAAYRSYWRSGAAGEVMPRVLWLGSDERTVKRATIAINPEREPKGLFVIATSDQTIDGLLGENEEAA